MIATRRGTVVVVLASVLLVARTVTAQPGPTVVAVPPLAAEAKSYLDAGLALFDQGQFDEAVAQLRLAVAAQRHPDIYYALGQAERKRGDCEKALAYFRSGLGFDLSEVRREAFRIQIERCEPPRSAPVPANPTPAGTVIEPPATRVIYVPAPSRRNWLGHALTAGGVAFTITGTVIYLRARGTIDDASFDYAHFAEAQHARTSAQVGLIVGGIGSALLGAGMLRYLTFDAGNVAVTADVATPGTSYLLIHGRF